MSVRLAWSAQVRKPYSPSKQVSTRSFSTSITSSRSPLLLPALCISPTLAAAPEVPVSPVRLAAAMLALVAEPLMLVRPWPMRSSARALDRFESTRSQAARLAGCAWSQSRLDEPRPDSQSAASRGSALVQSPSYVVRPLTPRRYAGP